MHSLRVRNWFLIGAIVAFATPALAVVKVYNGLPPGGTPGDNLAYSTTMCPPVKVTPGSVQGTYTLSDTAGGSVTMDDFVLFHIVRADQGPAALTSVFGPGAFVFIEGTPKVTSTGIPVSASGSTAPGGTVAWGVIGGWKATGTVFCIASPQTICTSGGMIPHGMTGRVAPPNSSTFDLGTWSFDAVGDLSATPYLNRTSNGGTSNSQRLIRGAYVGAGVPALPLVGAGALAIGFLIAGTRSVLRKK